MKVVLIKSPKILAPILRAVFKVKKIKYDDWPKVSTVIGRDFWYYHIAEYIAMIIFVAIEIQNDESLETGFSKNIL